MISLDAYTPAEIAHRVEEAAALKASRGTMATLCLAVLAGAFIALGAALYTHTIQEPFGTPALTRLAGGVAFSLGLILVCVAGGELFTGNNLLVMAAVDHKISWLALLRNWALVFMGNAVGAVGIALLMKWSGVWEGQGGGHGRCALAIAETKLSLPLGAALARGVLCNLLVCLAVWMTYAGRSVVDRVAVLVPPVAAFVALGLEHSVANMYFIPAAWLYSPTFDLGAALWHNLVPVTLGNMLGGGVGVGLVYSLAYPRYRV